MENKTIRNLFFDITTLHNLRLNPVNIIEILNKAKDYFVLDNSDNLKIVYELKDYNASKEIKYNEKNLYKIDELLKQKGIIIIGLRLIYNEKYYFSFFITLDYQYYLSKYIPDIIVANSISLSIDLNNNPNFLSIEAQNKIIDFFKYLFISCNSSTGYISIEPKYSSLTPNISPLEHMLELDYKIHSQKLDKLARGYFWGNMISKEHIKSLGGIENIKMHAPGEVIVIENNGRQYVYIQLSNDINDYSDSDLRKLKDLFRPILPEDTSTAKEMFEKFSKDRPGWTRLLFD